MNQRGFVLPSFLLSPTGIMAAVIVALSLSNALFYKLWQGKVDDYAQLQAQVSMERDQAKFDAQQAKDKSDRVTADVSLAWDAAYRHLKSSRPIRVLRTDSNLPNSQAGTTLGLNATPTLNPADPTAITAAECEALINDGVLDSAQLAWLQHWIRSQQ